MLNNKMNGNSPNNSSNGATQICKRRRVGRECRELLVGMYCKCSLWHRAPFCMFMSLSIYCAMHLSCMPQRQRHTHTTHTVNLQQKYNKTKNNITYLFICEMRIFVAATVAASG